MYAFYDKRCELHLAPISLEDTCFFRHCLLHCINTAGKLRDQQRRASMKETYKVFWWPGRTSYLYTKEFLSSYGS
jgi:hypothetical protein